MARQILRLVLHYLFANTSELSGQIGLLYLMDSPRLPLFGHGVLKYQEEAWLLQQRNALSAPFIEALKAYHVLYRFNAGEPLYKSITKKKGNYILPSYIFEMLITVK